MTIVISAHVMMRISSTTNRNENTKYNWCSHSAVMMKYSSITTAPKGKIPPNAMANNGCVYHTCSGMCLHI